MGFRQKKSTIPTTALRGFDRLTPDTMGVPSYDEGDRKFSLSVKSGQSYFQFWSGGEKYIKTTTQSKIIPDVSDVYYFYFDTSGILHYSESSNLSELIFLTCAICGLCSYNADTGKMIVQAVDEQHGVLQGGGMDSSTHLNLHLTRGFTWGKQGGDIIGLANGSDVYTSLSTGFNMDEDIVILTTGITSTPFIYRNTASGQWVETPTDLKIGHIAGGDTYISYNQEVVGAWQLVESTNSTDYIIYFMIKTNDVNNPYKKIVGQTTYSSRNAAREGLKNDLKAVSLQNLPSTEIEFQFAWIAKRNGDLEDDGSGNAYVDLRGIQINSLD